MYQDTDRVVSNPNQNVIGGAVGGSTAGGSTDVSRAGSQGPVDNGRLGYVNRTYTVDPYARVTPGGAGAAGAGAAGPGTPGAFQVPGYADRIKQLQDYLNQTMGRQAPVAQAVPLGPAAQAGGVTLGPAMQAGGVTLGPAAQAQAALAHASLAGPAAQAADSPFRANQVQVLDQLAKLMRGEGSVAGIQAQAAAARQLAQQQAMAASASPSNALAARRLAGQQMAQMGGDLEAQQLAAQQAERNAATTQYGDISGQARGQDLQLGEFNADQSNQGARLNASLGTQAAIANANNQTGTSQFNAGESNLRDRFQGSLDSALNQFNAGEGNRMKIAQGGIDQALNLGNAQMANDQSYRGAQLGQQNNQFNAGSQLTQTGLNNDFAGKLLGLGQGYDLAQQGGAMDYAHMINANQQGDLNRQNAIAQILAGRPQPWQYAAGAGAGILGSILPRLLFGGGGGGGSAADQNNSMFGFDFGAGPQANGGGMFSGVDWSKLGGGGETGGGQFDLGSVLGGATKGFGAGAGIGSIVPGIGTLLGGGIGALTGGLGSLFGF